MKLQLAIDRVSIAEAIEIIQDTKDYVDIIEIGTSLIKDFGLQAVREIRKQFPNLVLLADIKTIDEAEYEFQAVYEAGADIATVMGASAISSILACQRVALNYNKQYVIDLLEVHDSKLTQLQSFDDAIQCIHLASDDDGEGLEKLIIEQTAKLSKNAKIGAAGGITLANINILKKNNIDVVVVGSAITKAMNRTEEAKAFYTAIHK